MRAVSQYARTWNCNLYSRMGFVCLLAASAAAGAVVWQPSTAVADGPPGAPVINSFVLTELAPNMWRLTGTCSSSEGLDGATLYFGGSLIDEQDEPNPDGSFLLDVVCEPRQGDWVTVKVTDRWGMDSQTETEYF